MSGHSEAEQARRTAICDVYGRVQGVGFRFFVQDEAELRGLRGYVRNTMDRNHVEVVVTGPVPQVEQLLSRLRVGPPMARVERVTVTWQGDDSTYTGFTIRD